jgi:hypothetical protein
MKIDPAISRDVAYLVLKGHNSQEAVRLVMAEREEARDCLDYCRRGKRRRELALERVRTKA